MGSSSRVTGVAPDAYAPLPTGDGSPRVEPSPAPPPPRGANDLHLPLPVLASSGRRRSGAGGGTEIADSAALAREPSAHVNEVQFGFLDGAAELPANPGLGLPALRSLASPGHVSAHSQLAAEANLMQHLAGASGLAGPASARYLVITFVLLVMLGVISATIIFLIDLCVHHIFSARENVAVSSAHQLAGFFIYSFSGIALCLMATFACHVFSREAEGSGIPQMKAIMSGFYDKMMPALSMWALLAKTLGIVCAIGGGLPVGWEGPNVHISCIVAHHLSRLPFFRSLRRDRALRMQLMACACAVGLASSFGTPIGGVLYALETTSSFYLVATFWKSVLSTLAGAVVYDLFYRTPLVEAFANTHFEAGDYTRGQLLNFAVMGIVFGLLGAFFVRCVHAVYSLRMRKMAGTNRYVLLGVVGAVAALVQYPLRLFRLDPRSAINEFFSADSLETLSSLDVILLLLVKFPLIVVSIGLPVPAGVFIPSFLLGSGLGRLYGEVLRAVQGTHIVAGGYAVVGAAAFTAGVTRAMSCAVIIFEVTGQLKHMEPTLVAVVLSVLVGNCINRSLYDTLIIMKELPYMPHMRRDRSPAQDIGEVMHRNVVAVKQNTTLGNVREILEAYPYFDSFPVVTEDRLLLGSVRRRSLIAMLTAVGGDDLNSGGIITDPIDDSDAELSSMGIAGVGDSHNDITAATNGGSGGAGEAHEIGSESVSDRFVHPKGGGKDPATEEDANMEYGANVETQVIPDLSPLIFSEHTSLSQVHFMFVMLMPSHAFVLCGGRLAGVVTRGDIVQTGSILIGNEPQPA